MSLKITVIGTGYVGLVSGVCFAELGHQVTCVDSNTYKIQQLQNGEIPIYEPGLKELVDANIAAQRLHFSNSLHDHVAGQDAIFIAVGTPTAADGISADLSAVHAVARALAPLLKNHTVLVTKSTVPLQTNQAIEEIIRTLNPQAKFDICSNPEFLREGSAIQDFMHSDRVVVGVRTERARKIMAQLYAPLTDRNHPILFTTPESAELIKYASNALLAAKIAFINEMADLAEATNGNILDIAKGVGLDSRIGAKFLNAGPGYGGSCFPKDTRALAQQAQLYNAPSRIVNAVIQSNDTRKQNMAARIIETLNGNVSGKKIGILGVTFKANTDDMRDSVALDIIPRLLAAGAEIHAYDPAAGQHGADVLPQSVYWHGKAMDVTKDADALVLLTEWPEFKELDLPTARKNMRQAVLIDLRNFYDAKDVLQAGFIYAAIGQQIQYPAAETNLRIVNS